MISTKDYFDCFNIDPRALPALIRVFVLDSPFSTFDRSFVLLASYTSPTKETALKSELDLPRISPIFRPSVDNIASLVGCEDGRANAERTNKQW